MWVVTLFSSFIRHPERAGYSGFISMGQWLCTGVPILAPVPEIFDAWYHGWLLQGFVLSFQDRCVAALVRVEKTEFLSPVFIGEVAHVSAEITYTSKHSLEVQAKVTAENILTGDSSF